MKKNSKELNVDFIGEQNDPLTREEQLAISSFLTQIKKKHKKKKVKQKLEKQSA